MINSESLKVKFVFSILVATTGALLVACASMIYFNLRDDKSKVLEDLEAHTVLIGRAITPALQFDDHDSANDYLALLQEQTNILEAAIYNEKGKMVASYVQQDFKFSSNLPKLPKEAGIEISRSSISLSQRILFEDQIIGLVFVRMKYSLYANLIGNVTIATLSILVAALVAFLLSIYLQKNVIGSILSLCALARNLTATQDYSLRAEKSSNDELGQLIDAFNNMLDEVHITKQDLESSNKILKIEIAERRSAESALKDSESKLVNLNAELEQRVERRTAQLEIANKELESFSYSVSHDLRAPLRAIDGFSQALAEDYQDKLDETGMDYLRRVRAAAQKMGNLIDDMLKLSRVSRAEMNLMEVDLSAIAVSIFDELKSNEPDRKASIKVTSGLTCICDAHLIKIALVNLIGNAWKYTSKKEYTEIEFGMRLEKKQPAFFIQDNGAGFDMAYADKLFGAFQRLHNVADFAGTGVGLATVKRVINRHGGIIWADAKPDEGAIFYFTVPEENELDDKHAGETQDD